MSQPDPPNSPYVTPEVVPPRRASRGWGWLGLGLLLFLVGGGGLIVGLVAGSLSEPTESSIEERYHSLSRHASDRVAVIQVEGTIMEGDGFVKKQIDQVRRDPRVKAIVLRVNSPGGTVTGSDFILHHLNRLRKDRDLPLVVSMGSLAASGGYYISMSVGDTPDSIFAEPTTWTGSIGVVIPHYDLSQLAGNIGLEEDSIKSHRLKQMGSMFRKMTDEEQQIFQGLVDDSFQSFKQIIKRGRPKLTDEGLDRVATGQVFTTRQALEAGLIDRQGFIEEAIERAIELAGLDAESTRVVKYREPLGVFSSLFEARAQPSVRFDLREWLNLSTPRAWYLFAWPPAP